MPLDNEVDENATEEEAAEARAAKRRIEEVPRIIFTDAYRFVTGLLSKKQYWRSGYSVMLGTINTKFSYYWWVLVVDLRPFGHPLELISL